MLFGRRNMEKKERNALSVKLINDMVGIYSFLIKTGNRVLKEYDLNQAQFAVLGDIVRNPGRNQKEIKSELMLEKSNLSKIIKKLQNMSLVTTDTPEGDRRATLINPTEKGTATFRSGMKELDKMKVIFTESVSDAELIRISDSVDKMKVIVQNLNSENA